MVNFRGGPTAAAGRAWRELAGRLPALPVQDLGDLAGEVSTAQMAREEPQDDVLTLAEQPVLPGRVALYLALGAVELL